MLTAMKNWTLITGATSGIGWTLAEKFAEGGHKLILTGRSLPKLDKAAADLKSRFRVDVRVMIADLALVGAGSNLAKDLELAGFEIECLVNNAGFGLLGPFPETDLKTEQDMLQVNLVSLVELTHALIKPMVMRGSGRILNVASTAAFQPGPYMAVYYASKAFVLSFSLALHEEQRNTKVTITVLCPGPTRTNFQLRAGIPNSSWLERSSMDASSVAKIGYQATMRGDSIAIPGLANRIFAYGVKVLPSAWVIRAVAKVQKLRT